VNNSVFSADSMDDHVSINPNQKIVPKSIFWCYRDQEFLNENEYERDNEFEKSIFEFENENIEELY